MISVLVVDDDFRVAEVHCAYVSAVAGMQVVGVAHTAADTLAAVRRSRPDLVLLDNYLPDRSGIQLCAELTGTAVDVMMVTADRSTASVRSALSAGAVNYLIKPFNSEQLAVRLRAYGRFRARMEDGELSQDQIDGAIAALHEGDRPSAPKGQSPVTARLIGKVLHESTGPLSAAVVAEELGISRATAQRYLAALVEEGRLSMSLRYGNTGRPEHQYRSRWSTTTDITGPNT